MPSKLVKIIAAVIAVVILIICIVIVSVAVGTQNGQNKKPRHGTQYDSAGPPASYNSTHGNIGKILLFDLIIS